ncbi:hypothetical protein ACHAXA_004430 [Cyclostephanos tholiformis]|uniref:Uncharacterized protein n=1 Tax=Cyclostephanos tholiformis TaxID=382380 RepID=A0ABD3SBN8_9STRA
MTTSASPSPCYCGNAAGSSRTASPYPPSQDYLPRPDDLPTKSTGTEPREDCRRRLLATRRPLYHRRGGDDDAVDEYVGVDDHDDDDDISRAMGGMAATMPDPNRIHRRVTRLGRDLNELRCRGNDLAVRVASLTMENDVREGELSSMSEKVRCARERLDRMRRCLLDETGGGGADGGERTGDGDGMTMKGKGGGGLRDALLSGTREIRTLRFRLACRVFDMHRLDVGEQYSDGNDGGRHDADDAADAKIDNVAATGVGKIGGLPLPHAGPVLYGVIPSAVLASSLRLVASLTQLVASCLGVVLPHPILVFFEECHKCGSVYDFGGDVIDVSSDCDGRDDDGDDDDDDEYFGGDDNRTRLCDACLNEGMSRISPTKSPTQQHPRLIPHSQEKRRSSFLAIVGSSARRVASLTTSATSLAFAHMPALPPGTYHDRGPAPNASPSGNDDPPPAFAGSNDAISMSPDSISRRVDRASFAYLRESYDKSATEYVLNPPRWRDETSTCGGGGGESNNGREGDIAEGGMRRPTTFSDREEFRAAEERFATGLQLLQNDIVALCFRAGVDVSTLWPAESVLLNLHSLCRHCRRMADGGEYLLMSR